MSNPTSNWMTMTLLCFLATASAPVTWVYININGQLILYTSIARVTVQVRIHFYVQYMLWYDIITSVVCEGCGQESNHFCITTTTATLPFPLQNAMANELKYCYVPTLVSRVTWQSHDSHETVSMAQTWCPLIVTTYNVMRVHRYWMYVNATCIKRWKHEVYVITT